MQKQFQNSHAMPLSVDPIKLIKPETTLIAFFPCSSSYRVRTERHKTKD